jgi:heptaprenylglyceryl phosphate synthase
VDKKEFQKLLKGQKEEIIRHQKMILEEFQSRIRPIAEVQIENSKKFEAIFKKLDALMEMTALNTENIEFIKNMLKRKVDIEEHEALERRVSMLEKKLRST